MRALTMPAEIKVEDIADSDVDDSKKALITFLKLALIEYLNCDDR
jgi:hypothetical protein